jgi:hypothetical protein
VFSEPLNANTKETAKPTGRLRSIKVALMGTPLALNIIATEKTSRAVVINPDPITLVAIPFNNNAERGPEITNSAPNTVLHSIALSILVSFWTGLMMDN